MVGRFSAVKYVREREAIKRAGRTGVQVRGRIAQDEPKVGGSQRGLANGFTQQERTPVGNVRVQRETSFEPFSKDLAKSQGQEGKELRGIERSKDERRHQRIQAGAEAARIEMLLPKRGLLGDVREIEESSQHS